MSHFIAQSSKIVKLTDGKQTKYLVGWIGTDNNTTGYRGQLSPECIISEDSIYDYIVAQADSVASGSTQLKDLYNTNNLRQAAYMVKRLESNFRNAKTVQVDDLSTPKLDLSKNRELCQKLDEMSNGNGYYSGNVSHKEVDHDPRNKKVVDFFINYTKDPSIKEDHNSKVVELIDVMPALSGMLHQFSPISQDELYVALRDGDWYNMDRSFLHNDYVKGTMTNREHIKDLINTVGKNHLYHTVQVFSDEIKRDKELMLEVVKQDPDCIEHLEELKYDRDFVIQTIKSNYDGNSLLNRIYYNLKYDEEVVKFACSHSTYDIRHINGQIATKDLMLEILNNRIELIKKNVKFSEKHLFSDTGYKDINNYLTKFGEDKDIFETSFKFSPAYTMKYAPDIYKEDEELTRKTISLYPEYFSNAPKKFQENKEMVLFYLDKLKEKIDREKIENPVVYLYNLSEKLKDDSEVMVKATKIDSYCWNQASDRLKRKVGDNDPIKYFESVDLKNQLTSTLSQKEINPSQNDLDGILGNVFGNIQENSTQRLPSQSTSKKLKI